MNEKYVLLREQINAIIGMSPLKVSDYISTLQTIKAPVTTEGLADWLRGYDSDVDATPENSAGKLARLVSGLAVQAPVVPSIEEIGAVFDRGFELIPPIEVEESDDDFGYHLNQRTAEQFEAGIKAIHAHLLTLGYREQSAGKCPCGCSHVGDDECFDPDCSVYDHARPLTNHIGYRKQSVSEVTSVVDLAVDIETAMSKWPETITVTMSDWIAKEIHGKYFALGYRARPDGGLMREAVESTVRILKSNEPAIVDTIWADDHTTLLDLCEMALDGVTPPPSNSEKVREALQIGKELAMEAVERRKVDYPETFRPNVLKGLKQDVVLFEEAIEALGEVKP